MHTKMKINKKILSLLLASAMVLVMLPTYVAGAASDEPTEQPEETEAVQAVSLLEDIEELEVPVEVPEMLEVTDVEEAEDGEEQGDEETVTPSSDEIEVEIIEPAPVEELPVESIAEMEATIPRHLTSDMGENLALVARSQIGYRETDVGYSRYADWCTQFAQRWTSGAQIDLSTPQWDALLYAWDGLDSYSAWNASFVAFCLYYAGVEIEKVPIMPTAESWAPMLYELGLYRGSDYSPKVGDIIFLDRHIGSEYAEEHGFVGLVTVVGTEELWIAIGDYDGEVIEIAISPYDSAIAGYGVLPVEESATTGTEEITEAPEELTEEPSVEPTDEPMEVDLELIEAPINESLEGIVESDGAADSYFTAYALAPEGYVLICQPNNLSDGMIYTVDGVEMLYTEESAFTSSQSAGVFIALVSADAPAVIEAVEGERIVLSFNCDINGDGVLNIADANAVYQMAINGGDYYTVEQIGLVERMSLCYQSTEDLDYIVGIINGDN